MVFEIDDNDDAQDIDECDLDVEGPGVTKATSVDEMTTLTDGSLYLVYAKQLLSLSRIQVEAVCRSCMTQVKTDTFA